MMKELSLDDNTLVQFLLAQLDHMKQKHNESMVEYISHMKTLKNWLFAIEKDLRKQAGCRSDDV
jgi:hypothetical protein